MGDIVDMQEKKEELITQEEIKELEQILEDLLKEDKDNVLSDLLSLLSIDDKNFDLLAPAVLESYKQSLNNPNDKIALVQALNATGNKAEDLVEIFVPLIEEIDKTENLPQTKKDFLKEVMAATINSIQETEGIAKRFIQIPIELCHPDAKMPQYAHTSDSGLDLFAIEDVTIHPGETKLIPTGIKVALPPGYELQVRPKSGRALKTKLRVANTPGTIDAGYRDEIGVIVENVEPPIRDIDYSFDDKGHIQINSILHGSDFFITKGEKFAQLVLSEVPKATFFRIDSVKEIGENRGGGFGSTNLT